MEPSAYYDRIVDVTTFLDVARVNSERDAEFLFHRPGLECVIPVSGA